MWILGHEPAPDHSTIARYQNEKLVPVMEDLFYQLIEQLIDMNEVSYTNVFVDGTKMEANANKYSFVWSKAVEKNLKKLETKTEALTRQTALKYCLREDLSFEELLAEMMQLASFQNLSFVYGKGKRKTQIQSDIDLFCRWEIKDICQRYSPRRRRLCASKMILVINRITAISRWESSHRRFCTQNSRPYSPLIHRVPCSAAAILQAAKARRGVYSLLLAFSAFTGYTPLDYCIYACVMVVIDSLKLLSKNPSFFSKTSSDISS